MNPGAPNGSEGDQGGRDGVCVPFVLLQVGEGAARAFRFSFVNYEMPVPHWGGTSRGTLEMQTC